MSIKFVGGFETVESLPQAPIPEYAFIGRSNVGKSSLLNALVGQKVARTSNTPGRTQQLNMFEWSVPTKSGRDLPPITLMDLPGYGWAKVSKMDKAKWAIRLEKYLTTRDQLERLFILIDSRHGLKDSDIDMMNFCDACAIRYQIILTKLDKGKKIEREKIMKEIEAEVAKRGGAMTIIHATSAEKKWGIDALRAEVIGDR